eukprot:scaffold948_cov68-Phaeocystis_antarctica.AAC.6
MPQGKPCSSSRRSGARASHAWVSAVKPAPAAPGSEASENAPQHQRHSSSRSHRSCGHGTTIVCDSPKLKADPLHSPLRRPPLFTGGSKLRAARDRLERGFGVRAAASAVTPSSPARVPLRFRCSKLRHAGRPRASAASPASPTSESLRSIHRQRVPRPETSTSQRTVQSASHRAAASRCM